jgi:hypothetical protein
LLCLTVAFVSSACSLDRGKDIKPTATSDSLQQPSEETTLAPTQQIVARQSAVRFRLVPLQTCSSNGFTLPLVSADGVFAAVQSSGGTRWQSLLAAPTEAGVDGGRVTIHNLLTGASNNVPGDDLLLGRTADAQGCLIESPRPDGSRWIGVAPWTGGEPQWLVQDEQVNAFASGGPEDRLVWCRRDRTTTNFDLVIRHPDGEQVISAPEDGSWIGPQFTGDGRWIVVLRFRDGTLSACCFAVGVRVAETPKRVLDLSWRATASMAYQTVIPQRMHLLGSAQWAFFHPRFLRVALWDVGSGQSALLGRRSLSLVQLDTEQALVATTEGLELASMTAGAPTGDATQLLSGVWVPLMRVATDRAVIARPRGSQIDITRIELLQPD